MDDESATGRSGLDDGIVQSAPFIHGDQIYLRSIKQKDANGNYIKWMNDQEITRYMASGFFPSSREDLEEYIQRKREADNTLFLAIIMNETDEHIGNIKLDEINWIDRRGKVGVLVGEREHLGRDIAAEAVRLLSGHAFEKLNLRKITAACDGRDEASIKAYKEAGFVEEGRKKDHAYRNGAYDDHVLFALFRSAE